ncbi:amidase [Gracilibacillus sp. HCP3S3_G5_1]|uniref:amidase n=1 Tax=unclassified Gracilibacillus TaxID=2625209 RepID=UPI003F8886BD
MIVYLKEKVSRYFLSRVELIKNTKIYRNAKSKQSIRTSLFLTSLAGLLILPNPLLPVNSISAVSNVPTNNGAVWQVHDATPPGLDTGSLRSVSDSSIQGFGNIFVQVSGKEEPLFNGEMMRGFGLEFDGEDTFVSTQAVNLGGVHITRDLKIGDDGHWTRFFDTFTNTTKKDIEVNVSFGGALGYGEGNTQATIQTTSSGDSLITESDAWSLVATSNENERPTGVVIGSPAPHRGAISGMGNQERNPFETPMATSGHEANFYGYINSFTIAPGETKSLARFVLVGPTGSDSQAITMEQLNILAEEPDFTDLSREQICSLENWDLGALSDFESDSCSKYTALDIPAAPQEIEPFTTSKYDVVNKSIAELQADMEAGITTSEEITRAYLDRIAVYDSGPFGFHAFIHVANDAIEQAKAADQARKEGETGELLGIPIAIKDLFDTKDMPTTGGTRALEGWQPETDAYQVAKLRENRAVLIGKANMSEFARSGGYSESGWGQVWNALYPSKTSFGSSGGSAVAVATSMAAGAMGSQTGVSLYAPSVGASLTTFRGTDGMASLSGIMPLTWAQDYGGPIARTVTDLAYLLNATTGTDPQDELTVLADEKRPEDWTTHLDAEALNGKRIGYIPSSFVSSYTDDGTGEAVISHFADIEAAGGTMVEMSSPPSGGRSPGGSRLEEGWARYIELHENFPYANGNEVQMSPDVLPYNTRSNLNNSRMTEEQVDAWLDYRANYKDIIAAWMDEFDVDAVVYPGFISDMYNNDSSNNQLTSDRATGVLTSSVGLPTVVVPVGTNPNGYSISMQLVGRAWSDGEILGLGYALEQQTNGQQLTTHAPALKYTQSKRPIHSYEKGRPPHSYQKGRPEHSFKNGKVHHSYELGGLREEEYNE